MASSIDLFQKTVVQPSSVLIQELEGEAVLLHVSSGEYYGLDETGTVMWNTLMNGRPVSNALEQLHAVFDVNMETLRADFTALIEDLLRHGLLEFADE